MATLRRAQSLVLLAVLTGGTPIGGEQGESRQLACLGAGGGMVLVPADSDLFWVSKARSGPTQTVIELGFATGRERASEINCYEARSIDAWGLAKRPGYKGWTTAQFNGRPVRYVGVQGQCGVELWAPIGFMSCGMVLSNKGDREAFLDVVTSFRPGACDAEKPGSFIAAEPWVPCTAGKMLRETR